ncbi:hypothetical protein FIV71_14390 [Listeria monocytogenes]|uniref:hypothetical protein n=1 Tax=Listeria monocytogenes TaxID=1639 RepID=UPI0011EAC69A|nr:hypothetical protein [Listeria monocytogenes]EBF6201846.1 hypothetical protein [Listeria monocytogenes]TYU82821.1 hypothetical protein FZX01_15170 [Listeria monocytogenes]
MLKKFVLVVAFVFAFSIFTPSGVSASGSYLGLGDNWSARFDPPHTAKGKYHVHVYEGKAQKGAVNMDGSSHDGKNLSKVPKKVQKKLKSSQKYKNHEKKSIKFEGQKRRTSFVTWLKSWTKYVVIS